jgi:hypothetical protein
MRKRMCQYCNNDWATHIFIINESSIRFICLKCINGLNSESSVNNMEVFGNREM